MKKKSCLMLAMLLIMLQVIAIFAVVPANAASRGKSYNIYPIDSSVKTNGSIEDAWNAIPASEALQYVSGGGARGEDQIFNAFFKAGWTPVAGNDNSINLHFMVEVQDNTRSTQTSWAHDGFRFALVDVKNNSELYYANSMHVLDSGFAGYVNSGGYGYNLTNASTNAQKKLYTCAQDVAGGYILEFNVQIEKQAQIAFDIVIVDNLTGGTGYEDYQRYSWNGLNDGGASNIPEGIGYIIDSAEETAQNKVQNLYPISFASYAPSPATVESEWENIPAFSQFTHAYGDANARPDGSVFDATLKAAWEEKDANTITVYLLLEVKDSTRNYGTDGKYDNFTVAFEDDGYVYYRTPHTNASGYPNGSWNGWKFNSSGAQKGLVVGVVDTTDGYRAKVSFDIKKTEDFKFDLAVQDNYDGNNYTRISWNGWDGDVYGGAVPTPNGICRIADEPIGIYMTPGASIRVDTVDPTFSGIRFASSIDVVRYNKLIAEGAKITTGTLIIPTKTLNAKGIADASFTKEALLAAELEEGTHFYDIVNANNEWVEGKEGTWYTTLYDIKDNERQLSAVGYVTVELNGDYTTYYAQYKVAYARSIAQVAETVMYGEVEGDTGRWTAAQEAVLKSFFTQEA